MKKYIKTIVSLLLIITLVSSLCYALDNDIQDVYDYNGVIYDATKKYIETKNDILFSETRAKIIFTLTNSTDNLDTKTYAQKLYGSLNISSYGRSNSIFIVVSLNNNDYHFVKGKNLKYEIMDYEIYDHFINNFEPYFENKEYSKAVISLFNSLATWYESKYNINDLNLDSNIASYLYGTKTKLEMPLSDNFYYYIALGVFLIGALVVFKIRRKIILDSRSTQRRRMRRKHYLDAHNKTIDEKIEETLKN